MFYFEPQTGIVKNTPVRSNFYVYRLPDTALAKVQLAVNQARLDSCGFTYTPEFLAWLDSNDTHWNQRSGLNIPFEQRDY